ncbi:hypothetical protein [Methylomicrobium sp. Wu6]|uniref:hypothetical protein n=1 Tax=Methylomicrobium sp. Wu6 TaxID=3107928 RepID=UPI002DD68804|nr:hypothetical protein [Methylomicrobium sp. Wu6]MEC4746962.1 hypothetical protein [Methylomicrobium sp. Wu6]
MLRKSTVLFFTAVMAGVWTGSAFAVSILERAGNNFRTAANNQEFILSKQNVNANRFGLLHVHDFDAKVETQPLVVEGGAGADDLVIVTTMKNQVIGISARTNKRLYEVDLGREADSADMDIWGHTPTWGIAATPVIDAATNTLYVVAWMRKNANDNRYRDYKVFALNSMNGMQKSPPVRIFGQSQEGSGCWFNDANAINGQGRQYTYPKLRAGLALTGNNGLVIAFASNSESLQNDRRDNPHGFVIAYDTRGLLGQVGFSREPGIFCATSFNNWGAGIWQAGGAPVTEGDMIYVATSNGTSNNGGVDLAESMIKLRFVPGSGGSRPLLQKVDWYKAFLDERTSGSGCLWSDNNTEVSCGRAEANKAGTDWDFGATSPMLIPGSNMLLQGTKDGIIYALNKNDLGQNDRFNKLMFRPPLVASYYGGDVNENWARANQLNASIPCPNPGDVDEGTRNWFLPCSNLRPENNRMHHIHAMAFARRDQGRGIVYVWGENSQLKSYDFFTEPDKLPIFRAQGSETASGKVNSPGGMPGGLLSISGRPAALPGRPDAIDFNTAIVWGVYAKYGDSNKSFADSQLVAYDASTILPGGKLRRLFRTGDDNQGGLGLMGKMIPPVVANGRVYVMIYRLEPGTDRVIGSQLKVFGLKS